MTKRGRSIKPAKKRGKPHVPAHRPTTASKRGRWWLIGIAGVVLAIGVAFLWWPRDRSKPTDFSAPTAQSKPQSHLTAMLDAHAKQIPQSVSDIQREELALAEALVQDFPQRDAPLALLATVYQSRGDTTEAKALWKQAVALNPKRSDLYEKIGQAAQRKDQLDEAITWWRQGLEANPQAPGLRWQIANALVTQGHLDAALKLLEVECTITPTAARNLYLLGQIHLKQRAYEKAEAAYKKAIEIQPGYYNAYYGLGVAYTRLKQPEQARTAMKHFQRLKANTDASENQRIMIDEVPYARRRIVTSYVRAYSLYDPRRQAEIGERLLARALELKPNSAHIWEKLAGHHYINGHRKQALRLFRKASDLDPNNPLPCINIGKLQAQMNQLEPAENTLRKTVARFPNSGLAHAELAHLYLQSRTHLAEALALMQKAAVLKPTANHYYLLAWAYDANDDLRSAMDAIQKAIALEPQNEQYRNTYEHIRSQP